MVIIDINPKNKSNITEENKLLIFKIFDYMISIKKLDLLNLLKFIMFL